MHSSRMRTARSSNRRGGGCGCLSVCWDTPPRYGPGDPPRVDLETPLGVGLETPWSRHPLCGQTDTCKNLTLTQLRCGR